jgi:hypothetical protein
MKIEQMPEGWRRLEQAKGRTHWIGESGIECPMEKEFDVFLPLIKEMAEALDELTDETEQMETNQGTEEFWKAVNKAMRTYRKYKEWK